MKKLGDGLRAFFVSPEMVLGLAPYLLWTFYPKILDLLIKQMKDGGMSFGWASVGIALGMLAFCYKEGLDILSPSGGKKVILEWPEYYMLKHRVIISFAWCVIGAIGAVLATILLAMGESSRLAACTLVSGVLSAAVSTCTIGLARISIREVLKE